MTDDALREKLANETPTEKIDMSALLAAQDKEAPVAVTQSKYTSLKSWFVLHPKVKAAAIALAGVSFAAFDNAYNSNGSYVDSAKIAGAAAAVWLFAYLKSS